MRSCSLRDALTEEGNERPECTEMQHGVKLGSPRTESLTTNNLFGGRQFLSHVVMVTKTRQTKQPILLVLLYYFTVSFLAQMFVPWKPIILELPVAQSRQ
jgi:hypothetical protein